MNDGIHKKNETGHAGEIPGRTERRDNTARPRCFFSFRKNKPATLFAGILACLLWVMAVSPRPALAAPLPGVGFSFSRVVMMEEKRGGAAVDVRNTTGRVYLMQSRIVGADAATGMPVELKGPVPFLVLPPLRRVEAQGTLPLRIVAAPAGTARLPRDRESVFFLEVKAIPALPAPVSEKDGKGRVTVALANYIKLYWRPKGLRDATMSRVANTLSFLRDGDRLKVTNPSAYYLTFKSLTVGGKPVDDAALAAMVPPRGSQEYPLPKGVTGGTVSWRLIDEYGLPTSEQQEAVR